MINRKRLVSTFLELVKIDSPSGHEKKISQFVADKLKSLNGKVIIDSYGNIIAKFQGKGDPIILNSHLDTVEPGQNVKPYVIENKILSDGTTILGGDAKAGVAIIIETITSLKEDNLAHLPLEVIFTREEEIGLIGADNLDYSLIKSKDGITLDAVGGVENIIISAPGYTRIDVSIMGRSAHSGFEPEKGISAIKIASEIITNLKVGRIDNETSANIGIIRGGSARNAIPETVQFEAEIRSRNPEKLAEHTIHFEKIINNTLLNYPEAKVNLNIHREFNPYFFEKSNPLIKKIIDALTNTGLKPKFVSSGGGADVSVFQAHGIEAICLGSCYYNAHTTREYVLISEMIKAAKFCQNFVKIDK